MTDDMQSALWPTRSYAAPSREMVKRLDAFRLAHASDRTRWMPTRLLFLSYWLFQEQEFHFADGRMLIGGHNESGKSTILAVALPVALTGAYTTRKHLDTHGSSQKDVAYYLLGSPDDLDGLYHEDRTGYVAWEFAHPDGRIKTVGIGLSATRRGDATGRPQFWGFCVGDGRRIGHNGFHLHTGGARRVALDKDALRERLGDPAANPLVDTPEKYAALVNRELFGFQTDEQYRFLMKMLVDLRRPHLTGGGIKPSDVCQHLSDSLPQLDEELTTQVARVIEQLGEARSNWEHTQRLLTGVRSIDAAEALVRRRTAAERAWNSEAKERLLAAAEQALKQAHVELRDAEKAEQDALRDAERAGVNVATATATLTPLEAAVGAGEAAVVEAGEEVGRALERERASEQVHDDAAQRRERQALEVERHATQWVTKVERVQALAGRLRAQVGSAQWAVLDERVSRVADVVQAVVVEAQRHHAGVRELLEAGLDRYGRRTSAGDAVGIVTEVAPAPADPAATLGASLLDEMAEARSGVIAEVLARHTDVEVAESKVEHARTRVEQARAQRHAAEERAGAAQAKLDELREEGASEVTRWAAAHGRTVRLPSDSLPAVVAEIRAFDRADIPLSNITAPFVTALDHTEDEASDALRSARDLYEERQERTEALRTERALVASRPDLRPETTAAQQAFRAHLEKVRCPAVPLYEVCEFRDDVAPALAAAIEAGLQEAGLLDALIVPRAVTAEVREALETAGNVPTAGDRWLGGMLGAEQDTGGRAGSTTGADRTLADLLVPTVDDTSGLTAADVEQVLRQITVGAADAAGPAPVTAWVDGDRRWGLGPVSGQVARGALESAPEVRVIGAGARQRAKERELARYDELITSAKEAEAEAERAVTSAQRQVDALRAAKTALRLMREGHGVLPRMQAAASHLVTARAEVLRLQRDVGDADQAMQEAARATAAARQRLAEAAAAAPELEGLGRSAVETLGRVLEQVRQLLQLLKDDLAALPEVRLSAVRQAAELRSAAASLELARQGLATHRRERAAAEAKRDAIMQRLRDDGVEERQGEIERLKSVIAHEARTERERREAAQKAAGKLEEIPKRINKATEHRNTARGEFDWADAAFRLSLTHHPSLASLTEDVDAARAALAREAAARDEVREALTAAELALRKAFTGSQELLAEFRPEYDGSSVVFTTQGERLAAHSLALDLSRAEAGQAQMVDVKKQDLMQQFLLKEVRSSITERIAGALVHTERINRLLASRPSSDGKRLSLTWSPSRKSGATGEVVDVKGVVELLAGDPQALDERRLQQIEAFLAGKVDDARKRSEGGGAGVGRFADEFLRELDYRKWYEYRIHMTAEGPSGTPVRKHLSNEAFLTNSGARKTLNMLLPILCAVDAAYQSARPDAPKFIGLDEAFAGVDPANMQEMLGFLVDLGMGWIMTSEKLWNSSARVPASTTYRLRKGAGEPGRPKAVVAQVFFWDGMSRLQDSTDGPVVVGGKAGAQQGGGAAANGNGETPRDGSRAAAPAGHTGNGAL